MHRNPVKRGLVEKPEDWAWSSFRHYLTGVEGVVEIESEWTGRKRERMGMPLRVKITELPHPSKPGLDGAPGALESAVRLLCVHSQTRVSALGGAFSWRSLARSGVCWVHAHPL